MIMVVLSYTSTEQIQDECMYAEHKMNTKYDYHEWVLYM